MNRGIVVNHEKATILFVLVLALASFASASTLTIRPDGQGTYVAWANTGCSSSTEYQCVDETSPDTADYLSTSSKNVKESFTFGSTGLTTETINSVTLSYYAKYASSTRYKFQPLIYSGGTDYLGTVFSTGSSYVTHGQTYTTNPATGSAWTVAAVDALEAGMKSYSASYGGIVAQAYAVVDYDLLDSCADTDGGNVIGTQGTTSGYLSDDAYSHDDYCVSAGTVNEYYCSGNYEQSTQTSCGTDGYAGSNYCLSGDVYRDYVDYFCATGACDSSNTCADTDGGYNVYVQGTVSGVNYGSPYGFTDYCGNGTTLVEFFCSGGLYQADGFNCEGDFTGCSSGACY